MPVVGTDVPTLGRTTAVDDNAQDDEAGQSGDFDDTENELD
jgi:hypothetical protein